MSKMIVFNILLLWLHILSVNTQFEQPIAELKWRGKCSTNSHVLNDCNWCRCNPRAEYTCNARVCGEVDMWGHFNDAIREYDPGMEGHGVWRSRESACEPHVSYRRGGLLCVCNEDGNWPNPVCRDVFRILHEVEPTGLTKAGGQDCAPHKLYLVGCNVCFCSEDGRLKPSHCTKRKCTSNDPVLKAKEPKVDDKEMEETAVEIYADCQPDLKYKLGCKHCTCLRNNRLLCNKCTDMFRSSMDKSRQSFCTGLKPGETFSRDCNVCYCDKTGNAYCSVKKCLPQSKPLSDVTLGKKQRGKETEDRFEEENCTPGFLYRRDCNVCYCTEINGHKFFGCSLKSCGRSESPATKIRKDCVKGTMYELNCLVCSCMEVNGVKAQICQVNPFCKGKKAIEESRTDDLKSLHGHCEPHREYKLDCNSCTCLSDGQTVRCTTYVCTTRTEDPVVLDIVPIHQNAPKCPKGLSYKVDCNYCFCLSNGNALCTTVKCD